MDPNGKRETVFYGNGEINDTPEDRGTYNYGEWPKPKNWIEKYVTNGLPHLVEDIAPHYILGGPG